MIRAVADTNVYISVLNFGGVADALLALARQQKVSLFVSPPIEAQADLIISGDGHLKKLGTFQDIPIAGPQELPYSPGGF